MGHFSPPQVVYKKLVSYTSCVGGASASESLNEVGKIAKCIDVKSIIISKLRLEHTRWRQKGFSSNDRGKHLHDRLHP